MLAVLTRLFKKTVSVFSSSLRREWGKSLLWDKITEKQADSHMFFTLYFEKNRRMVKMIYRVIYISPL